MIKSENFEQVQVDSPAALRAWLDQHHKQAESVWIVTYKKSVPEKYVSTQDILDAVISYGWVDGIRRKVDDQRTMQLIAPRKTQYWAKTYKDRAARLEALGLMHEAGRASIALAKQNGTWSFMDDVDALISPPDLVEAFRQNKSAQLFFDGLPASAKRFTLRWIKLAKTAKTRQKRIAETVARSAAGEFVKGVRM